MIAFLKRCWQRRWIRGVAWTAITLVTLFTLFIAWVNWKGARVWNEAQQRVRDEKLTLDFRQTLQDPVPDTENFCAIPLLRDLPVVVDRDPDKGEPAAKRKALSALDLPDDKKSPARVEQPSLLPKPGQDSEQHMRNWAQWLRQIHADMPVTDAQNPAREVLAALAYQDAAVAEMAGALSRPHAQLLPAPKNREIPEMIFSMQLPHYSALMDASSGLAVRAVAATHAGEVAKAHEAVRVMARLSEAMSQEPFLIGLLASRSSAIQTSQVVWTLCQARAGTAEDFRNLQTDLERLDFSIAAFRAWEGELAAGVDALMYLKRSRDPNLFAVLGPGPDGRESTGDSVITRLLPAGWFDMNAANVVHMELDYIIRPLRDHGWQTVMNLQPEMERKLKYAKANWPTNLDKIFPALMMPSALNVTSASVREQCLVNQAIIACALERHYAEHQSYPESLETLKKTDGKNLPLDPADGSPMKYRKTEDGRYKLWSVGFDLVDDGGKAPDKDAKGEAAKPSKAEYKGDWVWEYAGK